MHSVAVYAVYTMHKKFMVIWDIIITGTGEHNV